MSETIVLDIATNRSLHSYSRNEYVARVVWCFGRILFRFSFARSYNYRSFILRLFGANVGNGVHISRSVEIFLPHNLVIGDFSCVGDRAHLYNLSKLYIGSQVSVSQDVYICGGTHDYTNPTLPLVRKDVLIDDCSWLCAGAFVLPGISVGKFSIAAARSVVTKDIPDGQIYAGNPARFVKMRFSNS